MMLKCRTFQQLLIVKQTLVRLEVQIVKWQIADFLSLKVGDCMLDITLVAR